MAKVPLQYTASEVVDLIRQLRGEPTYSIAMLNYYRRIGVINPSGPDPKRAYRSPIYTLTDLYAVLTLQVAEMCGLGARAIDPKTLKSFACSNSATEMWVTAVGCFIGDQFLSTKRPPPAWRIRNIWVRRLLLRMLESPHESGKSFVDPTEG